jgi:hypothetical protein
MEFNFNIWKVLKLIPSKKIYWRNFMNKIYKSKARRIKHIENLFKTSELIELCRYKLKVLKENTKDWSRIDWINFINSLGKFKICIVNNAISELKG